MNAVLERLKQLFPEGQWFINKASSGESNQAFIANNGEKKLFIKIGVRSPALWTLSELDIAPTVIYDGTHENSPYIIQEFIEGEKPDPHWFSHNVTTLAQFIKKYHHDAILKNVLSNGEHIDYHDHIERIQKGLDKDIQESHSPLFDLEEVRESLNIIKEKGRDLTPVPLVPTHADPNPQNFILTANHLKIIDWDDITLSDPLKDIGLILWWYIPSEKWGTFFQAYGNVLDEESLRWWIARNTLSIAAWYGKQGNTDYTKFFIDDALRAQRGEANSLIFGDKK